MLRSLSRPISQIKVIRSRNSILMHRTVNALQIKESIKERFSNRTRPFSKQEKSLQADVDCALPIATSKFNTIISETQQEPAGNKIKNISTSPFFGSQKPVPKKETSKGNEESKGDEVSTAWSPQTPGAA